jgi:hypothetical protein
MYSTVNSIFHFSCFDPDYATSGLTNRISKDLLYYVNIGTVVDVLEIQAASIFRSLAESHRHIHMA